MSAVTTSAAALEAVATCSGRLLAPAAHSGGERRGRLGAGALGAERREGRPQKAFIIFIFIIVVINFITIVINLLLLLLLLLSGDEPPTWVARLRARCRAGGRGGTPAQLWGLLPWF